MNSKVLFILFAFEHKKLYNYIGDRMITNTKEMLEKAKKESYAVPHFNINNLEWTRFILEECNELRSPVIIGISEGANKYMGGYKVVADMIKNLVSSLEITVPVAIHLDHGPTVEGCFKAIDAGYTSVMFDGSKYSLEGNIRMTNEVCNYAKDKNVTVEAEIGHIGGEEDGIADELAYAKVEDAVLLAKETSIDLLAPALGSVHGIYKGEPKLDFAKMSEISKLTGLPLVLHGGTGIPDEMIKEAIASGICKINVNTELQLAWTKAVKEFLMASDEYDPRKVIKSGESAMKEAIRKKVILFGSNAKY